MELKEHIDVADENSYVFIERAWFQGPPRIWGAHSRGHAPRKSTTSLSAASRLPLEIVETITTNLACDSDKDSLYACSRTCYSWYIAAVLYLHKSLVLKVRKVPLNTDLSH